MIILHKNVMGMDHGVQNLYVKKTPLLQVIQIIHEKYNILILKDKTILSFHIFNILSYFHELRLLVCVPIYF